MRVAVASAALLAAASAGTVSLSLTGKPPQEARLLNHHSRRDSDDATVSLFDTGYSFYVDVAIGTPPQTIPLSIDTGSSDPWTNTKQSGVCDNKELNCFTPFDLDKSNSTRKLDVAGPYDDREKPFQVQYGKGSSANGTYITETVSVAGITIKNQTLGAANQSDFRSGILGLGYSISFDEKKRAKDPFINHTIIDSLVNQGSISRRIFSLSIGHTPSVNGTLLFGGVDTGRYYDSLVSVPLVPSRGAPKVIEYAVKLEGLEVKGVKGLSGSTKSVTCILDNGTPQIALPEEMVKPILDKFEALSYTENGYTQDGLVNCAMGKKFADARFGIKFPGKTIYISGEQAVRDLFPIGQQLGLKQRLGSKADDWDGVCWLAFGVQLEGLPALVGDPMLRQAYAVYDLDNKVVALAQANIESTKHNVVEIGKDDKIPDTKGDSVPKSISHAPGDDGNDDSDSSSSSGDNKGDSDSGDNGKGDDKGGKDGKGDDDDADSGSSVVRGPSSGLLLAFSLVIIVM